MVKTLSKAARAALAATDWRRLDAMTDEDIARQIAANPDAAPDMAPVIDVRAVRLATGMTQAQFAAAYRVQRPDRPGVGARGQTPRGPARFCCAIKGDPEGLRRALAAA